jgi:Domain of unknown function (DUF1707)
MARRSALRASDSDRERAAERLRHAAGEGRLLASELEDRLGAAFSARTYGELDALIADLPAPVERRRPRVVPLWAQGAFAVAIVLAALAVIAVVALVVAGLFATWVLWLALGWFFFGRSGHHVTWSRPRTQGARRGSAWL